MPSELQRAFERITKGGLFSIVAYGPLHQEDGYTCFVALTTSIPELSHALRVFSRAVGTDYNLGEYVEADKLETLKRENPHTFELHSLRVKGSFEPTDVRDVAELFGPSYWHTKGVALVDICGFSKLQPREQLAYLLSLDNAVRSAVKRCRGFCNELGVLPSFSRSSTGDGYYLWHARPGTNADIAVFALLISIMVQSEAMRARETFPMRLKGAFAVGSVFTFYDRLFLESGAVDAFQNAVGPVTNDLARLIEKAKPSQILVKDFVRTSFEAEMGPNELLGETKGLFDSEGPGGCQLEFVPSLPVPPLTVTDKHGVSHGCWNLIGKVYNRFRDNEEPTAQSVGLKPEAATDITAFRFKDDI